jgi:hypothetical protein
MHHQLLLIMAIIIMIRRRTRRARRRRMTEIRIRGGITQCLETLKREFCRDVMYIGFKLDLKCKLLDEWGDELGGVGGSKEELPETVLGEQHARS